jgi:flagellar basal-body rod protein FlgF
MLRCYYTAGTGMLAQRDRMEVLSNNLTNVETTAYKSDSLISSTFEDMMIENLSDPNIVSTNNIVGALGTGTHIEEVCTSFEQGGIEETDRTCDFALEGDGFFVVSTPDGNRYTRDGSFSVSSAGYLVTSEGYYVQGSGGRIYVGGDDFTVDEQGNIYVGDALTDKFQIVAFEDSSVLRKDGSNLYYSVSGGAKSSADTKVVQGSLEGSNVDTAEELTRLLSVSNAYQLNQRVLSMLDKSLEKAVNEVGKVG